MGLWLLYLWHNRNFSYFSAGGESYTSRFWNDAYRLQTLYNDDKTWKYDNIQNYSSLNDLSNKLFISNKDSSFYLLLKVFKLFFTNSYFNLISYLLFPLILLISFNIRRARVAVLLAFCLLLSLDNSFIRNLFNYFDLIPSTIERILIRIYTTITYGNYYRLNFVKSLLLFYMFLDFLKALPFSSKTNVLNIYLFLVYVLNLIFTFKMLLDLSN